VPKLYEQFTKFIKFEIQHFRKLEQQRKVSKSDKAPRPWYNENQRSYPKPIHNIASDGCGPPENGRIFLEYLCMKDIQELSTKDSYRAAKEAEHQIMAEATTEALTHSNLRTACIIAVKSTIASKIAPSSSCRKEKWNKIPQSLRSNPHPEKSITP
jgi:hypothetical protein